MTQAPDAERVALDQALQSLRAAVDMVALPLLRSPPAPEIDPFPWLPLEDNGRREASVTVPSVEFPLPATEQSKLARGGFFSRLWRRLSD